MPRRRTANPQPRPCELCQVLSLVRYRIQVDRTDQWVLACPHCQKQQSDTNPHYRYGGTWKAR
jgi:hypothetical protein